MSLIHAPDAQSLGAFFVQVQADFFDPDAGGDPVMFQYLFWFFGHPEVYIWLIPIILATTLAILLAKRGQLAHNSVSVLFLVSAFAQVAAGFVTGHGMFTAGLDYVLHDTYYIIVHVRLMLWLTLFLVCTGLFYYFFRRIIGVDYRRWLGLLHWLASVIGLGLIFLSAHFASQQGMPSRFVVDQGAFETLNQLASAGAFVTVLSLIVFGICIGEAVYRRIRHGKHVPTAEEFT